MVKKLLIAIGLFILLLVVAFVTAGLTIPAERSYTNEIEINAPAEKVWQVINDRSKCTEWQTNLERVEVINERDPSGGAYWIEYPKDSPQPLKFTEIKDERPRRMEFDYTMGQDFTGYWVGQIISAESGVRLKTTDSYQSKGWLKKTMIYVFFDLDKFAKDWNRKLKERVEKLNQ